VTAQLELFAAPMGYHVPEDDSPSCNTCIRFVPKVLPLGSTGAWIGHAGDCGLHKIEVLTYGTCGSFSWAKEEFRDQWLRYLKRVGRA